MKKTSIIMAVFPDQFEYMKASIESIRRFTKRETYELIIVESGGSLVTRTWLADETDLRSLFFDQQLTVSQVWNEGIKVSNGDSILLIHEDTLVTENWLDTLLDKMYSDGSIGAVGPLTNYADDDQAASIHFSSMEELLSFSVKISETKITEERLTLSGFCLLIKRSVIETIGILDELLNGKASTVDLCFRIKEAGYSLVLCRHVYIHHYGSNEIKAGNDENRIFKNKWGISVEDIGVEINVLKLIKSPAKDQLKVLILGVSAWDLATAIKANHMYPNAEIHYATIEQIFKPFVDIKFDYIVLSSKMIPQETLFAAKEMLEEHGQLIVEMHNIHYFGVVLRLLLGEGLALGKKYWNLEEIPNMFEEAGFQELDIDYVLDEDFHNQNSSFISIVGESVDQLPQEFGISSFLISARKQSKDQLLHSKFTILLQEPDEAILSEIFCFSTTQIISSVERYERLHIPLLNYLGISQFERKQLNDVLPFLTKAYELDPNDSMTLINLATIMYSAGEDEKALEWLNQIEYKDEKVEKWIAELRKDINEKQLAATMTKFLLRRIENDVEREKALEELTALIRQKIVSSSEIIESVSIDIADKSGLLNRVAINSFNAGLYDVVLPLLEYSYLINTEDENTLFNLGSVLFNFGMVKEALNYLKQIREPNMKVCGLRQEIEADLSHVNPLNDKWFL